MTEGFAAWHPIFAPPADTDRPITPGAVFVFGRVLLPCFQLAPSGWEWLDSPRDLADYLLHVALPDLAGWWFDTTADRLPLEDTIAAAAQPDPEERILFEALGADLRALLAEPGPVPFGAVAAITGRFSTWFGAAANGMTLEVYPDAVCAGAALFDRSEDPADPQTGEALSRTEWLDLCKRAGVDAATGHLVAAVFRDDLGSAPRHRSAGPVRRVQPAH